MISSVCFPPWGISGKISSTSLIYAKLKVENDSSHDTAGSNFSHPRAVTRVLCQNVPNVPKCVPKFMQNGLTSYVRVRSNAVWRSSLTPKCTLDVRRRGDLCFPDVPKCPKHPKNAYFRPSQNLSQKVPNIYQKLGKMSQNVPKHVPWPELENKGEKLVSDNLKFCQRIACATFAIIMPSCCIAVVVNHEKIKFFNFETVLFQLFSPSRSLASSQRQIWRV